MPVTENLKFEVELKMSGSADFVKDLEAQLKDVNKAVKTVETSLNDGLGVSLDELIKKAQELSKLLSSIGGGKSGSGSGEATGVKVDLTPLITVLTRVETQLNASFQTANGHLQQTKENSVLVLEQVKLIRTKLYEIGSKFGVSAVSAGTISPNAIPVDPASKSGKGGKDPLNINVSCQCNCGNGSNPPGGGSNQQNNPPGGSNNNQAAGQNIDLDKISGYLTAYSAAVHAIGVYSAYAYDKTVDLKESLYAVTLSASRTQSALETVSQQQIISGYTTEQLKDATILLERMGASAKRYLPIAVNVAQKTGNKLAVVAEDLAGALNSLEALEAFQSKYGISDSDLKRNGAKFEDGKISYDYANDRKAAGEALSKALEQSFSNDNNINTYGEAVNNLQNSIEALAAKVGEQLLPVFIDLVSLGEGVVNWAESLDSSFIGSVSGVVALTGAFAGIIPVVSKLLPMLTALPATLAALGPYGWIAAGAISIAGYYVGKESSMEQQSIKELEAVRQESSEMTKIVQLAREFAEQKELAFKNGLGQVEAENKIGEELSSNVKKLKEVQVIIDDIIKKRARFLGDYTDYDDLKNAYNDTKSKLDDEKKHYAKLKGDLSKAHSKATRLPITFEMGQVQKSIESLENKLGELGHRLRMVKFYDKTLDQVKPYVENAQKKQDDLSVFEAKVDQMKKAVSVAENSGGDRTGHYLRDIISEEALAPLRNILVNNYERQLRKPGEDRSQAYRNLTDRNYIAERLFSLSKNGQTDSPLFKELQMLFDLLKKRDSAKGPSDFESQVELIKKAVSVAESSGGEKAGQHVRAIISEDALAPLKKSLLNEFEGELRKPDEDRKQAYSNLSDSNFVSNMLLSLSQKGDTDSTLFKELQMLFDLLKKRDSYEPKKDLETVLRELKESRGWQKSELAGEKRGKLGKEERRDPKEWQSLGEQLKQASEANIQYLQSHIRRTWTSSIRLWTFGPKSR